MTAIESSAIRAAILLSASSEPDARLAFVFLFEALDGNMPTFKGDFAESNWQERLPKLRELCSRWKEEILTLKGR